MLFHSLFERRQRKWKLNPWILSRLNHERLGLSYDLIQCPSILKGSGAQWLELEDYYLDEGFPFSYCNTPNHPFLNGQAPLVEFTLFIQAYLPPFMKDKTGLSPCSLRRISPRSGAIRQV